MSYASRPDATCQQLVNMLPSLTAFGSCGPTLVHCQTTTNPTLQVQALSESIGTTSQQAAEAGLIDGVKTRIEAMHYIVHERHGRGWLQELHPSAPANAQTYVSSVPYRPFITYVNLAPSVQDPESMTRK